MLGETKNQFSLTRAALSTCGRAKNQFLINTTRPSLKQRLEALLILLCGAAIVVGACVWFFGYYLPAVYNQKEEPPPLEPAKPATPETFKPLMLLGGHGAFWCRRR